jgi:hypothetical protein
MPRKPRPDQPVMASASRLIFGWGGFAFGTIVLQQHLDSLCDMGTSQRTPKPPSSHTGGLCFGGSGCLLFCRIHLRQFFSQGDRPQPIQQHLPRRSPRAPTNCQGQCLSPGREQWPTPAGAAEGIGRGTAVGLPWLWIWLGGVFTHLFFPSNSPCAGRFSRA